MYLRQNDNIKLLCPIEDETGTSQKEIFIMRVQDSIVIIDNDVGTPLKVKKGTWFKRLEKYKKHRTAFKEFLAKSKSSKTEIIGIDLK